MDTEKVDFDLATALREAFASARDEEATEARLALQSIEQTLAVASLSDIVQIW